MSDPPGWLPVLVVVAMLRVYNSLMVPFVGRAELSRQSTWRSLFLSYLSRPAGERLLYRAVNRSQTTTFLEMGVGVGSRAARILEIASWWTPPGDLRYTGIDLFESRGESDGPGLTLKGAYSRLCGTGAKVRLLPGTAHAMLSSLVGSLAPVDLVLASNETDLAALVAAYAFFPRFLHRDTRIFLNRAEVSEAVDYRPVPFGEIETRAAGFTRGVKRAG